MYIIIIGTCAEAREMYSLSRFDLEFFVLSRLSLSALSLTLSSKNRHRRKVEKKKKRSTKHFFVEGVSLSSGEIYDSNAQNRFRMAPRRLDRRSERVFHFQRTVERISRRARKEEY